MRMHSISLVGLLGTCLLVSCGDDDEQSSRPDAPAENDHGDGDGDGDMQPDAGSGVSFARDIEPIIATRCAPCHFTGSPVSPYFDDPFHPEDGIIEYVNTWYVAHESSFELVVKPGDPDASFLVYKVEVDPDDIDVQNEGSAMPWQIPRLTADELSAVRRWIEDGANDDAFFADNVAPIFGTEHRLGQRGGKCTYCHYEGSPTGLSVIDPFDPETGLVSVPSALSDKLRVAPGSPNDSFLVEKLEDDSPNGGARMPLHYPRLRADEVTTLREWIADGALDN